MKPSASSQYILIRKEFFHRREHGEHGEKSNNSSVFSTECTEKNPYVIEVFSVVSVVMRKNPEAPKGRKSYSLGREPQDDVMRK